MTCWDAKMKVKRIDQKYINGKQEVAIRLAATSNFEEAKSPQIL